MNITGNLTAIHLIPNRADLVLFVVAARKNSGTFNVKTAEVTCDGVSVLNVHDVVRFVMTREFTGVSVRGVDPDDMGGLGTREAESVELTTTESPVE